MRRLVLLFLPLSIQAVLWGPWILLASVPAAVVAAMATAKIAGSPRPAAWAALVTITTITSLSTGWAAAAVLGVVWLMLRGAPRWTPALLALLAPIPVVPAVADAFSRLGPLAPWGFAAALAPILLLSAGGRREAWVAGAAALVLAPLSPFLAIGSLLAGLFARGVWAHPANLSWSTGLERGSLLLAAIPPAMLFLKALANRQGEPAPIGALSAGGVAILLGLALGASARGTSALFLASDSHGPTLWGLFVGVVASGFLILTGSTGWTGLQSWAVGAGMLSPLVAIGLVRVVPRKRRGIGTIVVLIASCLLAVGLFYANFHISHSTSIYTPALFAAHPEG